MNLFRNADSADFQTQIKTDFYEKNLFLSALPCIRFIRVPFGNRSIWE